MLILITSSVLIFYLFLLQIHLGGMVFSDSLQRGIKKKIIPSPLVLSFPFDATYEDVIRKGVEMFFPNTSTDCDIFTLVDSNGIPYHIENKSIWTLSSFIKTTSLPPSKLRLYVMMQPNVSIKEHS